MRLPWGIPLTGMLLPAEVAGATMEAIFSNAQSGEIYATIVIRKEIKPFGVTPTSFEKYGHVEKILRAWSVKISKALEMNE